ncbi:MAG: NnrU family protein [Burkholderiales bacterium]
MTLLVAGLVAFIGVHLLPVLPPARGSLVARLGERDYRRLFSLIAAGALVAILAGFARAEPGPELFAPRPWARVIAPAIMALSLTLLVASKLSGHLRRLVRHPMLVGTLLWAGIHLAANGDRRSTVLFGAFFAWAVVDLASAVARATARAFEPRILHDAIAFGVGVPLTILIARAHGVLFGIQVYPAPR